ncbi:MAG: glutamate-cysteine ligase family protein [Patescibacteria group bacterium]|nr:glutamate-cysteine ligase family protein [Patescibacteria group bacterium]
MIDLTQWVNPKTKRTIPLCGNVVPRSEFRMPCEPLKIGIELELLVRDKKMNSAGMRAQEVFTSDAVSLDGKISVEALVDIVEVKTDPHAGIAQVVRDLQGTCDVLQNYFANEGCALLPISLAPLEVIGTPSFNHCFIKEIGVRKHGVGVCRLDGIASTQFNIDVGEGNALLYVHKAFRGIVPLLVSLTANSPFHGALNTHMLAMRANVRSMLLDSGGWMAENIHETDWAEYLERRARMCSIGAVMSAPWAHNGPLRLRPDKGMCLEISPCEVIPRFRGIGTMADFLRRVVLELLQCYISGEPLPEFFGASEDLAVQKNMQESVIRGRNGTFLNRSLEGVSTRYALEQLVEWVDSFSARKEANGDPSWQWSETVNALWDILENGTPAERMVAEFQRIHDCPNRLDGCPACGDSIREVCREVAKDFAVQFSGEAPCEQEWKTEMIVA